MSNEIIDRVSALIEEVGKVERDSEVVYLELGKLFPRLSEEMRRSTDESEESLSSLLKLNSGHEGHGSAVVSAANEYFSSLRERDAQLLARINEGITRLGSLDQIIARVRADSEEMEIISLNAMTVALKSGAEGKAFSVITDELKRLSSRTISLSEGVTASGRSLLEYFDKLRDLLSELDEFQRGFFETLDISLGSGYEDLGRGRANAINFFSKLLEEARSVREPVSRVMGGIQLQDIIRQSLQHVGISLEEARGSAKAHEDDESDLAFIASVAELSESLIGDIVGKLDASATSFKDDIESVSSIVSRCENRRSEFLDSCCQDNPGEDTQNFSQSCGRYLELKRSIVSLSSKLADHVGDLDVNFKTLSSLLERFQNIVVASRIEVAKTKALAGVTTTVSGMISLTNSIASDVSEAMETTKGFSALSGERRSGAGEDHDAAFEDERLIKTLDEVSAEMKSLVEARDSVHQAITSFSLYTRDFISALEGVSSELGKIEALKQRLHQVGDSLGAIKTAIRARIGPEAHALGGDRMQRLVERFTIFTHKKVAGDIARFAVEDGREAGEVTLF